MFEGLTITVLDDCEDYGEERFVTLGLLNRTVVVIVHTERPEAIQVISMRKATENEESYFFAQVGDELETDLGDEKIGDRPDRLAGVDAKDVCQGGGSARVEAAGTAQGATDGLRG